ncbi:phosphatidate cytidylyltransferase [Epidermidibacterium keratini]|uniref:Phosphatidate cytidylyltransferase n=2 Tax=Epidermidibacterium keratini TaxID=1891644 RepID=A0A7L4YUE2_9ACTN|nr:phosphatidate cytidylyltransferase [Epidermidibacterium keratini]
MPTDEAKPDAESSEPPAPQRPSRAGRDLKAAIGVGVGIGIVVIATLFLYRPAFAIIVGLAVVLAINELQSAVRTGGVEVPRWPILIGGAAMLVASWFWGLQGLVIALLATFLAVIFGRMRGPLHGYLASTATGLFITIYVPFLAGFAVLLTKPENGEQLVLTWAIAVVCSDTGGYASGVLFGKHPMAPRISPKKSWEGFAGSVVLAGIAGALLYELLLGFPWWLGVLYGAIVAVFAVTGDLLESIIKRDVGVKDMGSLLPGHGGAMDRMDSLLLTAPAAYVLLSATPAIVNALG